MQSQQSLPRGRALSTSTLIPRGGTLSPRTPPLRGGEFPTCQIRPASQAGFTLVELLVVIGIIALLAALVTPAVMQAQVAARNAAIKVEIDMLHMAIMNYKNEYGSFPPCQDTLSVTGTAAVNKHLSKLFPRASAPIASSTEINLIKPQSALCVWLSGYTGDPASPTSPATDRIPLYDFDKSRLASLDGSSDANFATSRFVYFPSGKKQSPYVYLNSAAYGTVTSGTISSRPTYTVATFYVSTRTDAVTPDPPTYQAEPQVLATGTTFFNDKTFQILCAGRDEKWGTDDDLSNFWPRTRGEYKESLNK